MQKEERAKTFSKMLKTYWKDIMPEFLEFSFKEDQLVIERRVEYARTELIVKERLFEELFKTFAQSKSKVRIFNVRKKNVFVFSGNKLISINTKPSLAFSMFQILTVLTLERLKKEKAERVIQAKRDILFIVQNVLEKNNCSSFNNEKYMKMTCYYKDGIFYLKIIFNKKLKKAYFFADLISEALKDFNYSLEASIKIK